MSMTLTAMATEVAKVIGGHNHSSLIETAKTAIKESIDDWNAAKTWNFLLRDNSEGFTVASVTTVDTEATISAPSTGAFDGVNIGVTVTGIGIPADTTVESYTRAADGTVASITLSNAANASGSTTLTFGGYIPIIVGTQDYNTPTDFGSPYRAYLRTTKRVLDFLTWREYLNSISDITTQGAVEAYTVFNPISPLTQNYGTYRLRMMRVPGRTDSLLLIYYATMNPDATTVAIPDSYLRMLITYARWKLLVLKDSEDPRLPKFESLASRALAMAMDDDEGTVSEDEDYGLVSQMDAWTGDRPLFRNGEYFAYPY